MAITIPIFAAIVPSGVYATAIEKLVMPGSLIEAHARFEAECQNCHAPMSELPQRELCVLCHINVGADVQNGRGFHGRKRAARDTECSSCHTDHEGRDAGIVEFDVGSFDHEYSDFPLLGAHLIPSCPDCHEPHEPYRDAPSACLVCHVADDVHDGQFGEVCSDCHTQIGWREAQFDHDATTFALTGVHLDASCSSCHRNDIYADTPSACLACHRSDDVHKGRNGNQCQDCHTTTGWPQVTFNHFRETGFPLRAGHGGLTCQDCHRDSNFTGLQGNDCKSCHLGDDVHEGRNGNDCGSCHGVERWASVNFDHAAATGFALHDAHGRMSCTDCHSGNLSAALPTSCAGCHSEDDVHRGQLGAQCEDCHGQDTWLSQVLFDHDLTSFPLVGLHAATDCKACHESPAFHDAPTSCLDCHRDDDAHGSRLGTACETCHNPGNWLAWAFDHSTRTTFPLTGAHVGPACTDCHSQPATAVVTTSAVCGTCHRRNDPHENRFGADCGRCHTTKSFSEVESL